MRNNTKLLITVLIICALVFLAPVEGKKKKGKMGGMGGMGGGNGPFGNKKSQMIFVTIREGYIDPAGIDKMAKDFQSIMSTGGIQVGIVGVDKNQMIAVANNIKELIEIRKFAVQMEQVLKVEYEKTSFPGKYITEEERKANNLREEDTKDDL